MRRSRDVSRGQKTHVALIGTFCAAVLFLCLIQALTVHWLLVGTVDKDSVGVGTSVDGIRPFKDSRNPAGGPGAARLGDSNNGSNGNGNNGNGDQNSVSASACLLVNDENPRLPEWIAYHHTVLPLRHLIIAIDPASTTSPRWVLDRWADPSLGLTIEIWHDADYLPPDFVGVLPGDDVSAEDQLFHHRERQNRFVVRCLDRHKALGRTWVLAIDVDEYVVFNPVRSDDPPPPLTMAPDGIPTLRDWSWDGDSIIGRVASVESDGTPVEDQTTAITTGNIVCDTPCYTGFVVKDESGAEYYLRDDRTYYADTGQDEAPPGVSTMRRFFEGNQGIVGFVDGELITTDGFGKPYAPHYGGQVIQDDGGTTYYLEKVQKAWPPYFPNPPSLALEARRNLPNISNNNNHANDADGIGGEATTILDVLEKARKGPLGEFMGPCLAMPRLKYGSRESDEPTSKKHNFGGLEGFRAEQFVTVRHRSHATKGDGDVNKFGKTIIDVSKVPESHFKNPTNSIHAPLVYMCPDPTRNLPYATSLFRVNHYMDTWEAHTYRRTDARSNKRQCRECYDEMVDKASVGEDNDIQGWLERFVAIYGPRKASDLLAGAGDFSPEMVNLS